MKVIRLKSVNSTQDYLKNILESQHSEQDFLIIAQEQTSGQGRYGNSWEHVPGSVACSFNLSLNPITTLTSIEMGILITEYFQKFHDYQLQLKWPNDIFYRGKKCGGILIHLENNQCIIGVGINSKDIDNKRHEWITGLDLESFQVEKLVLYIHQNRVKDFKLINDLWTNSCFHMNKEVTIEDQTGLFVGIGPNGEALIESNSEIKKVYSGSLRIIV